MNEPQDGFEELPSRFIVGIDLGTTNCAVAYVDTEQSARTIRIFPVQQWVDFSTTERRDLLPSFLYQPLDEELKTLSQAGNLPSMTHVVGSLARDRGLQLPGRQVSSAKSWLCHDGVDRNSSILPWQADEGVAKLSPVEASTQYLAQIRSAWDAANKSHPLAEQDIVLTLPASFDQVARQLTIEAAAKAGLVRILPIEEPQAAFYAWLARHQASWESEVIAGQTILVCDIGGGTTDFTLIRVREANHAVPTQAAQTLDSSIASKLSLHRVAVGQHLILGGDNIDLALAKLAEQKLSPLKPLAPRVWDALRQACRVTKELLLGENAPPRHTIHLPGAGSRLIGGGQQVEISAEEVEQSVLNGFFPKCELMDRPMSQQTGFHEFGLPFATDPAITRHLAAFLWDHRHDGRTDEEMSGWTESELAKPDWILFNGGVMTSGQLTARILDVVSGWFAGQDSTPTPWRLQVLDGERLDLAVAFGAAYFGQVRRGQGVAIEAKLACSYYLKTAGDPPLAICIVPGSASPGDKFRLTDKTFELNTGQPVQFPLVFSSTRLADRVGDSVELNAEHFGVLPPIRTVLELARTRGQRTIQVFVEVELSQIGTLQMYCHAVDSEHRWKLEFDVRASTQTDYELRELTGTQVGILDEQAEQTARACLAQVFSSEGDQNPSQLMSQLAEALHLRRRQWPPQLLRSIWAALMEFKEGRRKSPAHEARWLNLLGYALRPGYGLAADDWRVAQTWRALHGKQVFPAATSRNESLILWRRIAGGFTPGQQLTVYHQIAGPLRSVLDPARRAKGGGVLASQELIELLRLIGSLELLPTSEKTLLGTWLVELLAVKKWLTCQSAILWTIGRLGARAPMYGPLNCVVGAEQVADWLAGLSRHKSRDANLALAWMLCCRRVDDRYRDVSAEVRELALDKLRQLAAPEHYKTLVREGGRLEGEEAEHVLGEELPLGLRLLK